jgi:hypothetical protein
MRADEKLTAFLEIQPAIRAGKAAATDSKWHTKRKAESKLPRPDRDHARPEPSPVVWQKVTSMNGDTGWINGSYIAPQR